MPLQAYDGQRETCRIHFPDPQDCWPETPPNELSL